MYGPPSSVKVEPSSDVSSAYGMKNTGTRKISQVKPCAPWLATDPIVSSPTSVQTRKKNMSKRPKCFWSLAFSSTAADVVRVTVAPVADIGPSSARAVDREREVWESAGANASHGPVTTLQPMALTICDVGPRDGLQNEPELVSPEDRAELVSRLAAARLPRVEAVSFVRDDLVPQMAGAEEVVAGVRARAGDRAVRPRPERAGLRAARGGRTRQRLHRQGQLHARGHRDLQPQERERVARRGGRASAGDRRRLRPACDGDDLVRVRLSVRG